MKPLCFPETGLNQVCRPCRRRHFGARKQKRSIMDPFLSLSLHSALFLFSRGDRSRWHNRHTPPSRFQSSRLLFFFLFPFLSSRVAFLCQQPHVELVEERVSERVQSWERNFPTENGIAEEEEGKKEVDYNIEETEREKKKSIGTIVWIDSYGSLLPLFGRFHLGVGWSCYWPARESTILSPFLLLLLLKKRRKKSVGSLPRLGSAGVRENRNHAEAKRPPLARFTYMWI